MITLIINIMTLLEVLEHPLARRLFGKQELAIIRKQLKGISLTASERTRLSRDIRPKFEAVKRIAPYEHDFACRKGSDTERRIRAFVETLDKKHIIRIYLFGSYVDGTYGATSDIDIAVEFRKISEEEATIFLKQNATDDIDLSIYNMLPEPMQHEIKETGRILYPDKRGKT